MIDEAAVDASGGGRCQRSVGVKASWRQGRLAGLLKPRIVVTMRQLHDA